MDSYEVIMTQDSISDLVELKDYIVVILKLPETAKSYIGFIREKISSLEVMPNRISLINEEPWHRYGIRKMIAKNFYIYFRIDESNHKIYILNIIYTKQDQLKRLNEMNI